MNIYIFDFKSFNIPNIASAFRSFGHTVTVQPYTLDDTRVSPAFNLFFDENINDSFDMVFTFNYFPVVSNCCKKYGIPYISWVYDSPHINLYSYTVINACNHIFIFDKAMFSELRNAGIQTVRYLPLAADIKQIHSSGKFRCDASFVGSMYNEPKHQLFNRFDKISDYTRGYLDGIIEAQLRVYGYFMIEELLSDNILSDLQKSVPVSPNSDGVETPAYVYANYFIARRVTEIERRILTDKLSTICDFNLHTPSHNPVDYYNDMPAVFAESAINLNITLRSIKSGIPLRAFDIMSTGGFLLSNFQEDFLDYFVPNEDFVYYENIDDACKKVQYYLSNNYIREQIAANGFGKIKEYHTYRHRVSEILNSI